MTSLFAVVALAACGGSSKPAATTTAPAVGEAGEHGDDHAGMPAAVHSFHELLAPHWHAELGQARMDATCADIDPLFAKAEAVAAAATPAEVDADEWKAAADYLVGEVGELSLACGTDLSTFTGSFEGVHNRFHALIELLPHGEG